MGFNKLKLKYSYRSDEDEIYKDFYDKVMEKSISYDRAVGYFTSNSLKLISNGLMKFIENDGKIRIITSPNLAIEDINALSLGEKLKKLDKNLMSEWKKFIDDEKQDMVKIFSWLVATNKLEIKIAYQENLNTLYHEKFGIFYDEYGGKISFSGSSNETLGGMKNNFESIDVYTNKNSGSDEERIRLKEHNFNRLWENKTSKINVISFDKALKDEILKYKPNEIEIKKIIEKLKREEKDKMRAPEWLEVRAYQKEAFKAWKNNNYKGILEMATGTGKTITALNIMCQIENIKKKRICYIILAPQSYLAEQWKEECKNFNLESIVCNSDNNWLLEANMSLNQFNYSEIDKSISLIVTNSTFKGNKKKQKFLHLLKKIKQEREVMLIVDECHNIGTKIFQEKLETNFIKNIQLRLGLSATPDRQNDLIGNKIITNYLGKIIFKYSLKEAIEKGFLTEYYYYPYYVSLTENETLEYNEITKKITKLECIKNKSKEIDERLKMLYFQRSRILNLSEEKTETLIKVIKKNSYNNLIYVGAGKRENQEEKNTDDIKKNLELEGLKVRTFTAREGKLEREQIIDSFVKEKINAVIAIKCLDEGINIPSISRAYILASTTNYREYVQRRGRILRKSKNKSVSEIHDFILLPREYLKYSHSLSLEEKRRGKPIIEREMKRVEEYNRLAKNRYKNEYEFIKIKEVYNY